MKNIKIKLATIGIITSTVACKQTEKQSTAKLETLFKNSYDLKDVPTAITAVQLILAEDSTHVLLDSLPSLYLAAQNFEACLTLTNQALQRKPDNEELTKYKMISLEQLGKDDELLALSKKMFQKTGKVEFIYKQASAELLTGDFTSAETTINTMMDKFKNKPDSVDMMIDQMRTQKVPVIAACWNMKGYMFIQTQKYREAAMAFQKAIQIYPDFIMARRNLDQLMQNFSR